MNSSCYRCLRNGCLCCCSCSEESHRDHDLLRSAYGLGGGGNGDGDGDDDDEGTASFVEIRCWPAYDFKGQYVDPNDEYGDDEEDSIGRRRRRTIYLCRYLVPWCIARCLTRIGLDCGLQLSTGGIPGWMLGTRRGRHCLFVAALVVLVFILAWATYSRGRRLDAIFDSPCYVCNPTFDSTTTGGVGRGRVGGVYISDDSSSSSSSSASEALRLYAEYAYGTHCALRDDWIRALDSQLLSLGNGAGSGGSNTNFSRDNVWQRYDFLSTVPVPPPSSPHTTTVTTTITSSSSSSSSSSSVVGRGKEDWRNSVPSVYVLGCRGAGTTSFAHYLDAHPEIEVRGGALRTWQSPQEVGPLGSSGSGGVAESLVNPPWDDHFFARVPDWTHDELREWVRRGWGPPSLRDHQGLGKLRVEMGPDYVFLTKSGAAAAIRRARSQGDAKFVVLLRDPVALVQEAHARAVDAGIEPQTDFSKIVAHELPRLARCLWWDHAGPEEQRERIVSGMCGHAEPGRIGPPYLWRGLVSEFLLHWMMQTSGGPSRRQWYFIRAEDLMQQPNRTMNRLVVGFLQRQQEFDFGPYVRRVWHPEPDMVGALVPTAPYRSSWKTYLPRTEYLKMARKHTTDALFNTASRAIRKVVPGLQVALDAKTKLERLHCRLSGFLDPDTLAAHRCLVDPASKNENGGGGDGGGNDRVDGVDEDETEKAVAALRDFFDPFQERLMMLAESVYQAHTRRPPNPSPPPSGSGRLDGSSSDGDTILRDFFLGNTPPPPLPPL